MADKKTPPPAPDPDGEEHLVDPGDTATMDLTGENLRRWRNMDREFRQDKAEEKKSGGPPPIRPYDGKK